jgi:hypothetical protein
MTNEEHLEEILYQAHALGIADELTKRVPANMEYSKKQTSISTRCSRLRGNEYFPRSLKYYPVLSFSSRAKQF